MRKNRISIFIILVLTITAFIYIPTEISNKTEEVENPKNSSSSETFIFGTDRSPSSLDPHYSWDTASIDVFDQVVETLFAYDLSDPELNIIPRLAAGLGTWSVDGLRYTVPLKQGVTFHDGLEFNASAVWWNFERLTYFLNVLGTLPPENSTSEFSTLYLWPDGKPIINSTNIKSNYEIEFVLNRKFAPFEALLCFSGSGIMSPLSTPPEDYIDLLTGDLVGTGPFVYDNHIEDVEVNFHAYTNYWAGAAHIDVLRFSIIQDTNTRNLALLAGDIDFIKTPQNSYLQLFRDDPDITLVDAGQDATIRFLGMNNRIINVSFREAISYAINYTYMIDELLGGEAVRLKSPIPLGMRYANWSFNVPILNLTRARQVMQSMGFGVGFNVYDDTEWVDQLSTSPFAIFNYSYNIGNTFREDILVLLQDNLSKIGIRVTDAGMTWQEYLYRLFDMPPHSKNQLELFWLGWIPDYNDPSVIINFLFSKNSVNNFAQVDDDLVQEWMEEALITINPAERKVLYDKIQQRLIEVVFPWAWGYVRRNYDALSSAFTGFQSNTIDKVWFYPVYSLHNIVVSPLSYDFGEVELGTSESTNITIYNSGLFDITDIGLKIGSCGDYVITSTSSLPIPPSGSIDVEVTYTPSHLGSCSAILEIISDDPNNPYVEVQLTGRTQVVSNWLVNEVTLDGDPEEWTDTISYNIPLYHAWGWPTPIYQQSDKVLTVRFKNDGEWLYMFYEIPWSGPESPPESAGISYHNFSGNPQTNSDSGWVGLGGGTVDYYGWDGASWLYDELASGQNDVEGMGIIEGDYYRFEFRKRLDSKDGLDWSLSPGERVGYPFSPTEPPFLFVTLWDADTASVYQQLITLQLMKSDSILINYNLSLTSDIYFNAGNGIVIGADEITVNGNGYKIIGSGSGSGILNDGYNSVTIKNLTIHGFDTGISIHDGEFNNITVNYISDNNEGIRLTSALNNVTNNIIARNTLGVIADASPNYIYRNLLINNDQQILNVSGNIWVDPINNVGNFWSNYWGEDLDGDYIGDTNLTHEGVDYAPLLDPSIPEKYGPLPYADWWCVGRGGSPVIIQAVDPYGRIISADVNEIGLNAFYVENEEWDPGEDSIMILIAINPEAPIFGTYAYEITATEDTTYSLEWFVSAVGDILLERSVEDVPLDEGQTDQIGTVIREAEDPAPGDPPIIVVDPPPEIISITGPWDPLALGASCEMTGIFTDPDDDTHTAIWDWGDDTTTVINVDPANEIVTGSHEYLEPGVYTVTLTVEDSSGESDTVTWSQYMVIYDPSGSFVTGGGWIDSPEGAYPEDPDLSGKANFGFVAKYKKGAKVPTGNTEFKFHAGDLNFHSDTYQWLVIAGARAIFKGVGTINGEGSYNFILTAIDGELVSGGAVDKFRLKIWEEDEVTGEVIIYDNLLTEIGGGSIKIHKPN